MNCERYFKFSPCKDGNGFTTVPLKPFSVKVWTMNCLFSFVIFSAKLAYFLFSNGDSYRNKHVFSQKRFWSAVKVFIRVPLEIRHCHLCMEGHLNITITVPLKGKFLLLSLLHRVIATISFWSEKMFKSTVVN